MAPRESLSLSPLSLLSLSLYLSLSPHRHLVRYSTLFNAIYVLSFRMHSGNKQILP